jgi:hypothetical protein
MSESLSSLISNFNGRTVYSFEINGPSVKTRDLILPYAVLKPGETACSMEYLFAT